MISVVSFKWYDMETILSVFPCLPKKLVFTVCQYYEVHLYVVFQIVGHMVCIWTEVLNIEIVVVFLNEGMRAYININ